MLDSLPHDCIEHKLSKEKLERKMSTLTPGTSLPFVPGMTFSDPTKQAFHRSQTLGFTNGYAMKNQVLFCFTVKNLLNQRLYIQNLNKQNYKLH